MTLYNEIEPQAAQTIRNLITAGEIPAGEVNEKSIKDLTAADLKGVRDFHTFAGIGGWPLALRSAGWPADRQIWTGSCPCQPYSTVGKGEGDKDPRNLWPDFYRLIRKCRPATVIGEQVSAAIGHGWIDRVQNDMENENYAFGFIVLPACGVGSPHIRQRIYWMAHLPIPRHCGEIERPKGEARNETRLCLPHEIGRPDGLAHREREQEHEKQPRPKEGQRERGSVQSSGCDSPDGLAQDPASRRLGGRRDGDTPGNDGEIQTAGLGAGGEMGDGAGPRRERQEILSECKDRQQVRQTGFWNWSDYYIIPCSDGKSRRSGSGIFPLAHGLPRSMGAMRPGLRELAEVAGLSKESLREARAHRSAVLKGMGNAIVLAQAAMFCEVVKEITNG